METTGLLPERIVQFVCSVWYKTWLLICFCQCKNRHKVHFHLNEWRVVCISLCNVKSRRSSLRTSADCLLRKLKWLDSCSTVKSCNINYATLWGGYVRAEKIVTYWMTTFALTGLPLSFTSSSYCYRYAHFCLVLTTTHIIIVRNCIELI